MKNNKGQALVEFIIIMPILIMLFVSIFDMGIIMLNKYKLENELDTIISYYNNNDEDVMNAYASSKDISIYKQRKNNNMINIKISYDLELNTPLIKKIMGDNFKIETDRTIYEK